MPKKTKRNQKKPKKTKKAQKPVSNFECQPKPKAKKTKKNQKKPKKPKKNQKKTVSNFEFWLKPMPKKPKKNQKKPKKTNANLEILKNQKNPKKTKKNQCQFTDFGVATGFFFGFFWGEHPPPLFIYFIYKTLIFNRCTMTDLQFLKLV